MSYRLFVLRLSVFRMETSVVLPSQFLRGSNFLCKSSTGLSITVPLRDLISQICVVEMYLSGTSDTAHTTKVMRGQLLWYLVVRLRTSESQDQQLNAHHVAKNKRGGCWHVLSNGRVKKKIGNFREAEIYRKMTLERKTPAHCAISLL